MPAESTSHRRVRRLLILAAAGAACALGVAGAALPSASPAHAASVAAPAAAPSEESDGVRLSVAPAEATTVAAGRPIEVVVEIVNRSDDAIRAGALLLGVSTDPEDPDAEVEPVAERATASLAVGAATSLAFTLPADATDADEPVIGLAASLEVDGGTVSSARTIVANSAVVPAAPAGLALAYPLTVPPQETGLIPADLLESWTGPAGLLTRQLDAVSGRPVAVGIDPRIPASIRILGASAPESAVAWLERLAAMPNEAFPLAYADADLAAQAQAGVDEPLEPFGFGDAIDPADFPAEAGDGEATPAPEAVPDMATLLEWDFTRTDIAWPADDTVATGDLDWLAAGGLTTAILASGNVEPVDTAVNAGATIDGRAAVVADAEVTDALRAAASATSETAWRGATARALAELALAADEDAPVTLLGTFDRAAGLDADRVASTIEAVASGPWARSATLAEAVGAPPAERTLVSMPEDGQRIENVGRLLSAERAVDEFSDVLADPTVLTGPTRRDLLALLDVGWLDRPEEWTDAVGTWLVDRRAVTDAVSIVPSSSVLVVATETGIPITVQNDLPYPVDVTVQVAPSNGRLIVEEPVEATVEADSRGTVSVPVAAGVGSGEVTLVVSLTSPDGTPVGSSVRVPANVQADWEGVGAAVIAGIVIAVFAIGLIRAFRRRRRTPAGSGVAAVTPAPRAEASAAAPAPPERAPDVDQPDPEPRPEPEPDRDTAPASATAPATSDTARPAEDPTHD
ncbi:hypothetical protein BCL57_000997 [Agromyces flavus]|uniref:Uncharacterized protein n=1 Tax=Agromyces flavus TaxID=589382 RepID=A0A1H1YXK9_9MICO|nr:DUF6049 family protein [Agromyces flavus]MCP2366843.1 hypothetical protein [Agromyces flavus]GGI46913.1 hypothetical protein GCM10010932_17010 [Agromyces flavus]SDT26069.1 hypothetical protein SAMN04489721_2921 [Agromyces flavus]